MTRKLELGDVVKLSGKRMTLIGIGNGYGLCSWREPYGWGDRIVTAEYPFAALKRCFFQ